MKIKLTGLSPHDGVEVETKQGRYRVHTTGTSLGSAGDSKPVVSAIVADRFGDKESGDGNGEISLTAALPQGEAARVWATGFEVSAARGNGEARERAEVIDALLASGQAERVKG